MDDLIYRQSAIDALDAKFNITGRENAETIRDYINGVNKKLRELPSAERRGRWEDYSIEKWIYAKCSECGTVHDVRSNYCPNCGARMEASE